MTLPPGSRDIETRLSAALIDTARRNLSEATPPPLFRPDSSASQPIGRTGAWAVAVLAAAIVIAVIAALLLPGRAPHSAQPAHRGQGTLVTLRARSEGLSKADLDRARQVISARAATLGAANADVRIVGSDEITAFLPGVAASTVGDLGVAGALQVRPVIDYPPTPQTAPAMARPSGIPRMVDPWKSLGFAPPKDDVAFLALSRPQQRALQAVIDNWNCNDLSLDRPDAPIVTCSEDRSNKYLLGPTIVTGNDMELAALPANPDVTGYHWEIGETLNPTGNSRLSEYAAWHGGWQYNGHLVGTLGFGFTDFADTLDGVVIAESYIDRPITDGTVYAASPEHFDQHSTIRLTGYLNAGQLPTAFDVISIRGS
jgi:preprotein translocase subunit SecD